MTRLNREYNVFIFLKVTLFVQIADASNGVRKGTIRIILKVIYANHKEKNGRTTEFLLKIINKRNTEKKNSKKLKKKKANFRTRRISIIYTDNWKVRNWNKP